MVSYAWAEKWPCFAFEQSIAAVVSHYNVVFLLQQEHRLRLCSNTMAMQEAYIHLPQSEVWSDKKLRNLWDIGSLHLAIVEAHLWNTCNRNNFFLNLRNVGFVWQKKCHGNPMEAIVYFQADEVCQISTCVFTVRMLHDIKPQTSHRPSVFPEIEKFLECKIF